MDKKYGVVTLEIKTFIGHYGHEYTAAVLPKDIARGEPGMCFDWCALQAAKTLTLLKGKYRYVEGIATDPRSSYTMRGLQMAHTRLTLLGQILMIRASIFRCPVNIPVSKWIF